MGSAKLIRKQVLDTKPSDLIVGSFKVGYVFDDVIDFLGFASLIQDVLDFLDLRRSALKQRNLQSWPARAPEWLVSHRNLIGNQ